MIAKNEPPAPLGGSGRLSRAIGAAMIAGIIAGWLLQRSVTADQVGSAVRALSVVTDIFLRLVRMVIAPLVLFALISGMARMESAAQVGRIGAKTIIWFLGASLISLLLGMLLVELLQPGRGLSLSAIPLVHQQPELGTAPSFRDLIIHAVPSSIVDAMGQNEILQIVIFALFVGSAIAALPGRGERLVELADDGMAVMLKVTSYVMATAPLAIFAALASTVASQGVTILLVYAKFVATFYLGLLALSALMLIAALTLSGRSALRLVVSLRQPLLIAFSTASSEAAYPATLACLERFGIPPRIAGFVLPLGYSFNMDGAMMYCTFATLFIAQAYDVHLGIADKAAMLALLFVSTKGLAGVPRASLVVIAATLAYFRIPQSGLILILAVDHLLDMGRTAMNVVGNSVASLAIAKWEQAIDEQASALSTGAMGNSAPPTQGKFP